MLPHTNIGEVRFAEHQARARAAAGDWLGLQECIGERRAALLARPAADLALSYARQIDTAENIAALDGLEDKPLAGAEKTWQSFRRGTFARSAAYAHYIALSMHLRCADPTRDSLCYVLIAAQGCVEPTGGSTLFHDHIQQALDTIFAGELPAVVAEEA